MAVFAGNARSLVITEYTPKDPTATLDVQTVKTIVVPAKTRFVRLQNDADVLVTIGYGTTPATPAAGDLRIVANSMEWIQIREKFDICTMKVLTVSGAATVAPIYGN